MIDSTPLQSRRLAPRLALAMLTAVALAGAVGCVHRIDIQQGNFLEAKDVERVTLGMTRVQVRALLGTPMVADPFQSERWDYLYYLKKGRSSKIERQHFIVFFDEQDKVSRIERPGHQAPREAVAADS